MNFYKFNRIIFVFSVTVCLEMTKADCDGSGDGVLRRFCWADLLALPAARRAWFWCGASCAWRWSPAPLITWKGGWSGTGGHHLRLLPFASQSSVASPRPPFTSSAPTCSVFSWKMDGSERSAVRIVKKSVGLIKCFTYDHDLRFPSLPNRFALPIALSEEAGYLLRRPWGWKQIA